jgi:hypothetical protein
MIFVVAPSSVTYTYTGEQLKKTELDLDMGLIHRERVELIHSALTMTLNECIIYTTASSLHSPQSAIAAKSRNLLDAVLVLALIELIHPASLREETCVHMHVCVCLASLKEVGRLLYYPAMIHSRSELNSKWS